MIRLNQNTALVYGDLYTDMKFNVSLLSNHPHAITIHAKGDIIFECPSKPNKMKSKDSWMSYEEFMKKYPQGIRDFIIFSNI